MLRDKDRALNSNGRKEKSLEWVTDVFYLKYLKKEEQIKPKAERRK